MKCWYKTFIFIDYTRNINDIYKDMISIIQEKAGNTKRKETTCRVIHMWKQVKYINCCYLSVTI